MKILYIAFARIPTEKAHGFTIAKSCESFARAGAEVTLVIPRRATKLSGDVFAAYGLERNFHIQEIPVPDIIGTFGGNRLSFWIHYLLFIGAVKLRLLFGSRKRIIYTREPLICLFHWLGYRVVLESHLIQNRPRTYYFLARRACRIVVISRALKDAFSQAGFAAEGILVAPSGVDIAVFDVSVSKEAARRELRLPTGPLAVYTGNFTTMGEDKGLHDIIRALPTAHGITFVAVGGSEKDIALYRRQAEEAGISDRVILLPYAPQKTLALYQKAADVLLMPFPDTPHYRNHMSPVKMFEYMASGTPIIASDLPTIREVLNEANAILVTAGNPAALAQALIDIMARQDDARERAAKARRDVEQYSWATRTGGILRLISPCNGVV